MRHLPLLLIPLTLLVVGCNRKPTVEFVPVSYYSDTMKTDIDSLNYSDGDDLVQFEINLMLLQEDEKFPLLHSINNTVLTVALANDYYTPDPSYSGSEAIQHYCNTMHSARVAAYQEHESGEEPWSFYIKASPTLQTDKMLSFVVTNEQYMGGAHGMHSATYLHFSLATGNELTIDSLFVWNPENHKAVEQLIYEGIRQLCVDDTEGVYSLDDFIFTPDGTNIISNFMVNPESLTFWFNPYDIAPYSLGGIGIEVPSYKLYDYLRKDAPLYLYWFKK